MASKTTDEKGTESSPTIKSAGKNVSKIVLVQVDEVPAATTTRGRKGIMQGVVDQLVLPENHGKWFKIRTCNKATAYQTKKRLNTLLPGASVEIRTTGADLADVYTSYAPDPDPDQADVSPDPLES